MRQPREAIGAPTCSRSRPAGWTSRARRPLDAAKRELAEEIGQAADALGAPDDVTTRAPASPTRRSTSTSPPACGDVEQPETDEDERIEIVRWPLADLDGAIDAVRDAKTLIGLLRLRRAPPLNGALQRRGRRGPPRRTRVRRPRPTARAEPGGDMSTSCSTSSPTWSSSAGCRATRSRPTAPTCSSSASYLRRRAVDAAAATHAELAEFVADARRRASDDRRRRRARDAAAQGRVPALLLPPPAPRGPDRARPDRRAARAAPEPASCRRCSRRDEVARLLAQPKGTDARRAARPRAAGAHVRLRAARVARRSTSRSATSTSRRACCAPAARAPRSASCRSAAAASRAVRAYLERGRPELVGAARRARTCSSTTAAAA